MGGYGRLDGAGRIGKPVRAPSLYINPSRLQAECLCFNLVGVAGHGQDQTVSVACRFEGEPGRARQGQRQYPAQYVQVVCAQGRFKYERGRFGRQAPLSL